MCNLNYIDIRTVAQQWSSNHESVNYQLNS